MIRLFSLFLLFAFCNEQTLAQHFQQIDLKQEPKENESIPFKLSNVELKTNNADELGMVASLKDDTPYPLVMVEHMEKSMKDFLDKRFSPVQQNPKIIIQITTMRLAPSKQGKFAPTDTFLFECRFISDGKEKETLYHFKARNSFGLFNEPDKIMSNYISRALVAAVHQFTKSYNKNPDWSGGNSNPLFKVKVNLKHNVMKDPDVIFCKSGNTIQEADFNGKLPTDSVTHDVISKLILTYKAESEETSKGIELNIETKAYFDKNRSWKKPVVSNTAWLSYQQGHFDLCTIYGMKLKDSMENFAYSIGEFRSELNKIYNDLYAQYVAERKLYADETSLGTNTEKMMMWRSKLNDQLKRLKN